MIVSVFRSNKDMMDSNNQLLASLCCLFTYKTVVGTLQQKRSVYCTRTNVAFAENQCFHFSKKIMGWEATDINGYYKSINC